MPIIGSPLALPDDRVVHRVVERHARTTPDARAVTSGPFELTFGALNDHANRIAHALIARDVGAGSIVGVCLDRTLDLLPTIIAVLKCGAAYVPLDPTYPSERLGVMLGQLPQPTSAVVGQDTRSILRGHAVDIIDLDEVAGELARCPADDPELPVDNQDLCYVVFTSGSTGTPKAAAVRHEGWFNLLEWLRVDHGLDRRSSGLCVSSFGFDITQRALMAPLFTGACSHLLPSRNFDPRMARRLIETHGVSTLHCAPSTLYALVEDGTVPGSAALTRVDHVFIGGEPLNAGRIRAWAQQPDNHCRLWHQYGVAECTDVAAAHLVTDFDRYERSALPAGRPVHNTQIHLADELSEVADGEVGEICISGVGVGAGYLGEQIEGRQRFTTITTGGREVPVYRTGDRGYADDNGELVVVGRMDHQVKIRGMRIDLGDVEHAVRGLAQVQDAVVLAVSRSADQDPRLVAYVVPDDGPHDPAVLRRDLFRLLPRNMVPEDIVALAELPLNPNGKVDRRALTSLSG